MTLNAGNGGRSVRYRKKIMIVNYGMGNLGSVENALRCLGGNFFTSNRPVDLGRADAFILPGVGAFGAAMENLQQLDLITPLHEQVMTHKKTYLGICLGMQILAINSEEQGHFSGLGWIDGHVGLLAPTDGLRVPHVGWNNVTRKGETPCFRGVDADGHFYFDHSFHLQCDSRIVVATCEYGGSVVAAIQQDNIFATQFHPEKSQRNGLKILRNFLDHVEEM